MELKFTGKGSAFYPTLGSTGASFVTGDHLFLLDCGESVFESLYKSGILDRVREVYVLLTHLHCDHVGSLGSLISYCYCIRQQRIHVFHPSTTAVELLRLLGIKDSFYHYHQQFPQVEGVTVRLTAHPVRHVDNMECFGYTVVSNGDSFYYSGDSTQLPEDVLQDFLAGTIRAVYHDVATIESGSHCNYKSLLGVIPPEHRHRFYCMHLDGDNGELLRGEGFAVVEATR